MSQRGFTMLEILVSMLIFMVVSLGMARGFLTHLKFNTQTETKTEAVAAAQIVLDNLRNLDPSTLPSSGSTTQNVTVGRRTFLATTTYCAVSAYCASFNNRHIRVEVSFGGASKYTVETVYTQLR